MFNKGKTFASLHANDVHIVAYGSRKFDYTEVNWKIVEKETSAIPDAVRKHGQYLIGKKLLLRTDNGILTYLMSKREPKRCKLLNWALELGGFDFEIERVESKKNG